MAIGENLRNRRKELGMSQQELSIESEITQAEISYIESGKRKNPGVITIKKLAEALGTTLEELIK